MQPISMAEDETILALRRALDRHARKIVEPAECVSNHLIHLILGCFPCGIFEGVLVPTGGADGYLAAVQLSPAFQLYATFAAEYWAGLVGAPNDTLTHLDVCASEEKHAPEPFV